ncbi:MAG TPA: hypothetical protein VNG53_00160 [Bacteroidia bacterium]|nr:hypothetical protein [Bacteroidia bacterium]
MKTNSLFLEFHRWNSIKQRVILFVLLLFTSSFLAQATETAATTATGGGQSQISLYTAIAIGVGFIAVIAFAWFLTVNDSSGKSSEHNKHSKIIHHKQHRR